MTPATIPAKVDVTHAPAPLRVLLDCRMATWTGVGRYTVGLTRALAAREDISLSIVIAEKDRALFARASLEAIVSAKSHPFSLGGALEMGRIARRLRPDVTHCAHFLTPLPAPHPLVVTVHDISPLVVHGIMPSALKRAIYRRQVARAVRVADRILVDAPFTVGEITRIFPSAAGRITSIPIAADDFSAGHIAPLTGRLAGLAGERYILTMGSTRAHKDIPTLLRAFALLAPAHPELRLLLAGEGEDGYLDAHLAGSSESVRSRVAFTGRVTDHELRSLYASAAVFAFPSLYEGFGLPPLEAMSLGAPVVVADAASLPDVVADAALLMPPGDAPALVEAIERIIGDTELRTRLIAAGRARAAQLTWEATGAATTRVYRAVTSASPGPGDAASKAGNRR